MIPFIIAEQEGDVMIIKRRCAKEIEIGCVFDDHEGTPGVSYHFFKLKTNVALFDFSGL